MGVDPVTFQVLRSRISGIVQQMQENIFRTGYSTIVRETQDASCVILDANGDVVGEHVVLPMHVAVLPEVIRSIRRYYGDRIFPGDVFITNHPYEAGITHSVDMAVVTPAFHGDRLVGFCASIAHKSDLGGMVPGTGSGNARELFQEGVQYPPVKYMDRASVVQEVEAILRANSRTPDLIMGDIRGQIGTARIGERRLNELIDRYGIEDVLGTFAEVQDKTEARVRQAIAGWNDGVYEAEAFLDNDGVVLDRLIRFHVRIEKSGERIVFDLTGSGDQAQGPINIRPPLVRGCCYYAMIALIDPTLSNNGGIARTVEIKTREGSVVNPRFPAPTNTYTTSIAAVTEALLQAMNGLVSQKQIAGTGGTGGIVIAGTRDDGAQFVQYEVLGSAYGGRAGKDGVSGVSVLLSNTRTAPIEVIESEFPTRVRRFELIQNSGGAGLYKGGLAAVKEYEILAKEGQFSLRGSKHTYPAFGVLGGHPGRLGSCTINAGGEDEQNLPSRFGGVRLKRGDVISIEKPGGGGLGDPKERAFERVLDDVLDGYIDEEAAIKDYDVDAERLAGALREWRAAEQLVEARPGSGGRNG